LRRKTAKLERNNDILEGKVSDKDRDAQEFRKRADDATYEMNKVLKQNVVVSEGALRKDQRVESTVNTLKDVQVLLKNAETKIESQKKESIVDKKKISELKAMNQDLKNKFDGLMALRRKTERECINNEEELKKRGKELESQSHKMESLARELEDSNKKNEHLKKTISKVWLVVIRSWSRSWMFYRFRMRRQDTCSTARRQSIL
jgi:DNA repair exonuclease SbcCD ATPase subunit